MKHRTSLHPNQIILGAVQEGRCAELSDINPYTLEDRKRRLGWEQGHYRSIKEHERCQRYANLSWFRKVLCKLGVHKHILKLVPGRPHINRQTGAIDRRDPVIKRYTCDCGDVFFVGLRGA